MNGIILSVANRKGGVGKTTTTINLAQAFALHKLKVLIVDLDPQGNSSLGLGIDLDSIEFTSGDFIRRPDLSTENVAYQVGDLHVVPAKRTLANVEMELIGRANKQLLLAQRLRELKSKFDVILIDTPPSFGPLFCSSLNAADKVVVPIDCAIFAMQGIKDLLGELEDIRLTTNPNVSILGFLLTLFDNTKIANDTRDELIENFGDQVFETCISRSVKLKEAPAYGKTIFHHAFNSTGARDYLKLSIEIMSKLNLVSACDQELRQIAEGVRAGGVE